MLPIDSHRHQIIQGLIDAAVFFMTTPGAPVPSRVVVQYSALHGDAACQRAEVDQVAHLTGDPGHMEGPHYISRQWFGPAVSYQAAAASPAEVERLVAFTAARPAAQPEIEAAA